MNKVISDQLDKVINADLSNYNPDTNTYIIPKKVDIKLEEDCCYLIYIKPSAKTNSTVNINWNNGSYAPFSYMKVDISKKMGKMIKVTGIEYDNITGQDLGKFWSGWISMDDIKVLTRL